MDRKRTTTVSKFFSKHLRHDPAALGLTLQTGGWVLIDDLLAASANVGLPITRTELDEVVRTCDKQRFAIDETGTRIRANQGHSVEVNLELTPATPPAVLYHGSAEPNHESILRDGLQKMRRHHVHLSRDTATARKVGARHGVPVLFAVDTEAMARDGFSFYVSSNGVWLVDAVPRQYLRPLEPV